MEKYFINDCYSCRKGKGTKYGIKRIDHFVKSYLGIDYYGRYVDDLVLMHNSKEYLQSLISIIRDYRKDELMLQHHPDRIYLQHYSKGVRFLGTIIKPYRIYVSKRIKGNFHQSLASCVSTIQNQQRLTKVQQTAMLSSINSYLGIFRHFRTFKLRKKTLCEDIPSSFWNLFAISNNYLKIKKVKRCSEVAK